MGKNNKKFTYEYVKGFFEEKGCVLLSCEYVNSSTPLEYICACGERSETTFNKFKNRKYGCRICTGLKKYTQQEVETYFAEQNCEVISTYTSANEPLEYICECGNPSITTFWNFRLGKRCLKCGFKKTSDAQRHSYEYVKEYFETEGCQLLSDVYISVHDPLDYICECGRPSRIAFSDFQNGKRCRDCGKKKIAEHFKNDYDYVKNYFVEHDCTLLEITYENAHQKLKYICDCGNKSEITFDKFKQGQRCNECGIKKLQGENHPNWNPNITNEEREILRKYPDYSEWNRKVKERDHYTCQSCGQIGYDLVSHHLENYADNKELRTNIDNGVTLCNSCHREFHKIYGYRNTTKNQFEDFLLNNIIFK